MKQNQNKTVLPNLVKRESIETTKKLADVAGVQKFKKKIQEQAKERQSEAGKEFGNGETKLTKIYHKLWMEM